MENLTKNDIELLAYLIRERSKIIRELPGIVIATIFLPIKYEQHHGILKHLFGGKSTSYSGIKYITGDAAYVGVYIGSCDKNEPTDGG